jgi:hypothetical protein
MNKKIIIIATIIFALVFILLLALMMGSIMAKGTEANTQLTDTLQTVSTVRLDTYKAGETVTGAEVINCIANIDSVGGEMKLGVSVSTTANRVTSPVNYTGLGTSGHLPDSAGYKVYGYASADNTNSNGDGAIVAAATATTITTTLTKTQKSTTYELGAKDQAKRDFINPNADFYVVRYLTTNGVLDGFRFIQM